MPDKRGLLPEAYMLIGTPASGKSTYAKNLKTQLPGSEIICLDVFRSDLARSEGLPLRTILDTPDLRARAQKNYYEAVSKATDEGKKVILDGTHIDPELRKLVLDNIRKPYRKIAVLLKPENVHHSVQTSLGRDIGNINAGRVPQLIPYRIMHRRHQELVPPASEEGFDEVRFFTVKWETVGYPR